MSLVLRRHAWAERRAAYRILRISGHDQAALPVKADASGPEAVCSVAAIAWRWGRLAQGPDVPLLVAGNPRRWSVVTQPGVPVLLPAKRPWLPLWGRLLRNWATGG